MPKGLRGFQKGQKFTEEHRRKISETRKKLGFLPPSHKGFHHSEEAKRKISLAQIGKKHSDETKRKIGIAQIGRHPSEETRKKLREAQGKEKNPMFGRHHSEETKSRMRKSSQKNEKHWNWQGGKSFEPYSVDWTITLKRSIRERDKYICRLCGEEPAIICHHIDYNKKNCNSDNLITLCETCHGKTQFNRNYWIDFFRVF